MNAPLNYVFNGPKISGKHDLFILDRKYLSAWASIEL